MTQGIEQMLNLPALEDVLKERGVVQEDQTEDFDAELAALVNSPEFSEENRELIEGKDHAEAMDQVFKETLKHAQDIVDLGFNIDTARAARMFEVAATMYAKALDAKNSKRDSQLKAMKLMLDQRRLELEEKRLRADTGQDEPINGEATIVVEDRNVLIAKMREQMPKKD